MADRDLQSALVEWRSVLGGEAVVTDPLRLSEQLSNCVGVVRVVPAMLCPSCTEDVVQIVSIAARYKIALYPFSTGRNWGYGSANPVVDGGVLVNLSGMNRIVEFDDVAGVVTVEPGVTQKMLDEYLQQHNMPFLVPVTGAGPDCSLVGNALERGYGITPYADHFGAVMSLEAVLPSGEIYRSMLDALGGGKVDRLFKWGVGPYLDGLFSQGGVGIVTRMTLALAPRPERVEAFFFSLEKDQDLELAVEKIRKVLRDVGGVVGSINLMNKYRVLAMSAGGGQSTWAQEEGDDRVLREAMRRNNVLEWTSVGAIYGNKKVVSVVRKLIRKALRPVAKRLIFLTPNNTKLLANIVRRLPIVRSTNVVNMLDILNKSMRLINGSPSEVALPLAYLRSGKRPVDGRSLNPARDGCGLIWYAPLVPMRPELVREYVTMVESICSKHGFSPLITLTSLSDRCWDSTVPILFDRSNPDEVVRAHACYDELLETGCGRGFVPYRFGIQSMDVLSRKSAVPLMLKKLKQAIDPDGLISPGRYGV